jgi:hypothetical protein
VKERLLSLRLIPNELSLELRFSGFLLLEATAANVDVLLDLDDLMVLESYIALA